jgi:nitroimidazol reductase NimA-like FMN-containing flavoprotein (pyridoxamine 5'-phosphate oxidase superfamily)
MTEKAQVEDLLRSALVGRIGTIWQGGPYVVPVCFAYDESKIFFHSARVGRKMECLRANSEVCFEVDEWQRLVPAHHGCAVTVHYRSVLAYGRYEEVTEEGERLRALELISHKYAGRPNKPMSRERLDPTLVGQIVIDSITGRRNG